MACSAYSFPRYLIVGEMPVILYRQRPVIDQSADQHRLTKQLTTIQLHVSLSRVTLANTGDGVNLIVA